MRNKIVLFMTIMLLLKILSACQNTGEIKASNVTSETVQAAGVTEKQTTSEAGTDTSSDIEIETETQTETIPVFEEYDIKLMAVGDNLMHMGIINSGKMSDGTYDYSILFDGISEYLYTADIKIINQETILGGNELGFSGFPYFNSPVEVSEAIANAGFNVVLHASNHSADKGINGLKNCVSVWERYPEVTMTGIYEEAAELQDIPVITIKNIDFAILNYTYSPNMEIIPTSIQGHLDILCDWDKDTGKIDFTVINPQVLEDIERAEEIADVVIVCPHWGTEYHTSASTYQQEFALQMTEAGADLIIGTHPHVIQPVEWVESANGNKALCYYSLGNYVSTQKDGISMLEAMAWVNFHVTEEGVYIDEEKSGAIPMVCHYTSGPVRLESVYMLENYTQEQAAKHGIRNYGGVNLTVESLKGWSEQILGEWELPLSKVAG